MDPLAEGTRLSLPGSGPDPKAASDPTLLPLTPEDRQVYVKLERLLLMLLNAALLGVFLFACWISNFERQAVLENAVPMYLVIGVPLNVVLVGMWLVAKRRAKRGRKEIVSGIVDRIEDGPADDETRVKLVHLQGKVFSVHADELGPVVAGQYVRLHYFCRPGKRFEALLKVEVGRDQPI